MLNRDVLDACRLRHRCPPVLTKHSQYGLHPLASNQNTETLKQEIFPQHVLIWIYQLITLWSLFIIYKTFFTNSQINLIVYHVKGVNQSLYFSAYECIIFFYIFCDLYYILAVFVWINSETTLSAAWNWKVLSDHVQILLTFFRGLRHQHVFWVELTKWKFTLKSLWCLDTNSKSWFYLEYKTSIIYFK